MNHRCLTLPWVSAVGSQHCCMEQTPGSGSMEASREAFRSDILVETGGLNGNSPGVTGT